MTRRFRPTHAFVDESIRGQRYLMGCVLVDAKHLASLRVDVQGLVLSGGRVHFHNESSRRRRDLLARFAEYPIAAFVVVCHRAHGVTEFRARERCLSEIVERLQRDAVLHLVLESRYDDSEDRLTIPRVRRPDPPMLWEHCPGAEEPLLWIADGVTWAVGAGADWRPLVAPILRDVVELRP